MLVLVECYYVFFVIFFMYFLNVIKGWKFRFGFLLEYYIKFYFFVKDKVKGRVRRMKSYILFILDIL